MYSATEEQSVVETIAANTEHQDVDLPLSLKLPLNIAHTVKTDLSVQNMTELGRYSIWGL